MADTRRAQTFLFGLPPEPACDDAAGGPARLEVGRPDRAVQRRIGAGDAEPDGLARPRHVERAEQPVPQREDEAEIAVPVLGRDAVVDLVLRRADDDVAERTAPRQ